VPPRYSLMSIRTGRSPSVSNRAAAMTWPARLLTPVGPRKMNDLIKPRVLDARPGLADGVLDQPYGLVLPDDPPMQDPAAEHLPVRPEAVTGMPVHGTRSRRSPGRDHRAAARRPARRTAALPACSRRSSSGRRPRRSLRPGQVVVPFGQLASRRTRSISSRSARTRRSAWRLASLRPAGVRPAPAGPREFPAQGPPGGPWPGRPLWPDLPSISSRITRRVSRRARPHGVDLGPEHRAGLCRPGRSFHPAGPVGEERS
jgi:hypothetical protein